MAEITQDITSPDRRPSADVKRGVFEKDLPGGKEELVLM